MGKNENMMEKNKPVIAENITSETTTSTMDMMNSSIRRHQERHEAARKFALGVVSDVGVPSVLSNCHMNNAEVPVVVLKKNTVVGKNNNCDIEVPEASRKSAYGVVPDVGVPGVLLNDKMNNVDVPDMGLNK